MENGENSTTSSQQQGRSTTSEDNIAMAVPELQPCEEPAITKPPACNGHDGPDTQFDQYGDPEKFLSRKQQLDFRAMTFLLQLTDK